MLTHLPPNSPAKPGGRALKPIGSLMPKASELPQMRGSQPTKSPQTSQNGANTGPDPNPSARSRPTGSALTATTSSNTPLVSLRAAFGQDNPAVTDSALEASLTQLIGQKPKPKERAVFPKAGGCDVILEGFHLPKMTPAIRHSATILVEKSLMPLTESDCIGMLGQVKLLTACRAEQQHDLEAQLTLYARMMQDYPADVTRHVLKTQPKISKWWPTWMELSERLELYTKRRKALLNELKRPLTMAG